MTKYLICILALGIWFPTLHAQGTKLTQAQILHLIEVHAPDELVASQIRARGLGFTVTAKLVESITAHGAGPLTAAELREQIRTGTVEIHTEPGASVTLDGRAAGVADASGVLLVSDVAAGNHNAVVKEDSFLDGRNSFVIGSREHKQISIPLQWTGGYLTLSVLPAEATVAVAGPRSFTGTIASAKCPAGNYSVTASADGYVPLKREFQVGTGEQHVEQIHLSADPAVLARLEDVAKKNLAAGDIRDALQAAEKAAQLSPSDPSVTSLLSAVNFQKFMGSAADARSSGNWRDAIVNYQRAAQASPKMGEPWLEIGSIQLEQGRFEDAKESFTRSADLGFPVALHCVEHKALWNDAGTISIGPVELKFMLKGREVYRVPISQVSNARIGLVALAGPNGFYFDLTFAGKKHRFEYNPDNTECSFFNGGNLICSGNGFDQQRAVAEWVSYAVPKYAQRVPMGQ